MQTLSKADLMDIVNGGALLGSGGGGPRKTAVALAEGVADDFSVEVVTVEEAAADTGKYTVVVGYGGSPSSSGSILTPAAANVAYREIREYVQAILGGDIGYVVPIELGAVNSLVPCIVAADNDVRVVDGDGCGRAVPYLRMLTFAAQGVNPDPMVIGDDHDHSVILNCDDVNEVDALFKAIVSEPLFGGVAGFAFWIMDSETLQRAVTIRGTLSLALGAGRVLREAKDPPKEVARWLTRQGRPSRVLFTGTVASVDLKDVGGVDVGRIGFEDVQQGSEAYVFFQNEGFTAWQGHQRQPVVLGPDSIGYLLMDGTPFTNAANPDDIVGQEACVIGTATVPEMVELESIYQGFREVTLNLGYGGALMPLAELADSEESS